MSSQGNHNLLASDTGIRNLQDACIIMVTTEWNSDITTELEQGCHEVFAEYGLTRISTLTVPGSVEIPFAVKAAWNNATNAARPDAFITLGCVIRGGTPHFEYVCQMVTSGVLQLNLQLPVPVIFGVLTVDYHDQAKSRTGGKYGHKGREAALTALKMIALNRSLQNKS
jgi:6,7-dimethyl-8-ribityllumazine synthase